MDMFIVVRLVRRSLLELQMERRCVSNRIISEGN